MEATKGEERPVIQMTEKAERTIEKKWLKKAINFGLVAIFAFLFFLLNSSPVEAGNQQITFQGKLTNSSGNSVSDGTYYIKATIYDASTGGTCQYTASSTCASVTSTPVTVTNGIFSINLGDTSASLAAISPTLFNNSALYLGITVCSGAGTGCDSEMTPRKRLTAAPYAFNADYLSGLATSTIGGQSSYVPVTDSSGNLKISNSVFIATTTAGQFGVGTTTVPSGVKSYVEGTTATDKLLVLRGNSSQSGNLQEWQNSAGTALVSINSSGNVSTSGTLAVLSVASSTISSALGINSSTPSQRLVVNGGSDASVGIFEQNLSSNTASILQLINYDGDNSDKSLDIILPGGSTTGDIQGLSAANRGSIKLTGGSLVIGASNSTVDALAFSLNNVPVLVFDGVNNRAIFKSISAIFGDGSTTTTLTKNSLILGQTSSLGAGTFYVDSSGNVSASGSLKTFGNVTSTGNLYALSGTASTSILNGSSLTLGQGTNYNSGMFNVDSNGNVSASGTLNVSSTIKINGTQVAYLPNQTNFVGTLVFGDGGTNMVPTLAKYNTFIGIQSGNANTNGTRNSGSGWNSLGGNSTGYSNSAFGVDSLNSNTTGFYNTAVGDTALGDITTGGENTALGYCAGYDCTESVSTPITASSTFLGAKTTVSVNGLVNAIVIGYGAQGTASNQVVLGNTSITQTLLRGNVGIGYNSPSDKLTVYGGNLRVGNGTVSSTLGANFFAVATSTTNMNGLFYVDSSGNTSVSGTLSTFDAVTLGDSVADVINIVGILRTINISDNTATTSISNSDMTIGKATGYNQGVFNVDLSGNTSVSGTLAAFGNTTWGNSDTAGGDTTRVYGTLSMGATPTGNAMMYLKATSTTAIPLLIEDNSGNAIGQLASSSVEAIVNGAQVTVQDYSLLTLGNANGKAGVLSIRAANSVSPGAIVLYRDATAIGAQMTPGTLIVSGGGSGSTSTLDSLALTVAQQTNKNQGVFYVDNNGNTSASGTLALKASNGGVVSSTGGNLRLAADGSAPNNVVDFYSSGFKVLSIGLSEALGSPGGPVSTTFSSFVTDVAGSAAFVFKAQNMSASTTASTTIDRVLAAFQTVDSGTATNKVLITAGGHVAAKGVFMASNGSYGIGDMAEYVNLVVGESVESGDVIIVDTNSLNQYRKSDSAYAKNVAGVISDTGAFIIGSSGEGRAPLALAGLVKTKVTDENGPIAVGDYLVSASLPGYAMKYDENSGKSAGLVGMALESWADGEGKITIMVNKGLVAGGAVDLSVSQNENGQLVQSSDMDMSGKSIFNLLTIKSKDNKWMIDEDGYLIVKVATKEGDKKLYGLQSGQEKELVLSGSSQFENGLKKIELPVLDQEVVDPTAPIKVSVTLTGEAKGVFVSEKNYQGFTVKELGGGTSNATFDWMLIAKRRAMDYQESTDAEPELAPAEAPAPVASEVTSSTSSEESASVPAPVETPAETSPGSSVVASEESPAPVVEPVVPPAETPPDTPVE